MSRRVLQSERKRLPGLMVELNKGSGPPCLAALGATSPMSSRQEPSTHPADKQAHILDFAPHTSRTP